MDKKVIIYIIIAILVISGLYFIFGTSPDSKRSTSKISKDKIGQGSDPLNPMGNSPGSYEEAVSPFLGTERKSYLEIIEDLKSGRVNFVWEVWGLREKCAKDLTPSQCDNSILDFIDINYSSPDKEKIRDLFQSYFTYEAEARQLQLPEKASFEERYEIIKKKRREILKQEKAELIYGMEESLATFMEASRNFLASTKNMNPSERVKKFEDLRRKTYGSYTDAITSREDKFDHYQMEVQLREKELSGLSGEEKEKKLHSLEVKYFGKDAAEKMAKQRKEESEEQGKVSLYEQKEKEFLNANSGLSQKDKDAKLNELRISILGKEEAEAYQRRKQFEEETSKIK